MPSLNPNAKATDFVERMSTRAGTNSRMGDPDAFGDMPTVKNALAAAHQAVHSAVSVVQRLTKDDSRTDVSKAHKARQAINEAGGVAMQAAAKMNEAAAGIEKRVDAALVEYSNLDKKNETIVAMKLAWLKEQYRDAESGQANIAKAVEADRELGSILCRSDCAYLTGIGDEFRGRMVERSISKWLPETKAESAKAGRLREIADKMPKFIQELHSSSYMPVLADKWNDRVERCLRSRNSGCKPSAIGWTRLR